MPGGQPSISDLIGAPAPTFSFEFFPPKDAAMERQLWQAIRELEPLHPSFVSVTYGAGGSTPDNTVAGTKRLATDTTRLAIGHRSAAYPSASELSNVTVPAAAGRTPNIP